MVSDTGSVLTNAFMQLQLPAGSTGRFGNYNSFLNAYKDFAQTYKGIQR
jgi:hypothetical protein